MLEHKPFPVYNGLAIVLSHPSRFDYAKKELLSGNAGSFIRNECLKGININECYIVDRHRGAEVNLPKGTRVVLHLYLRELFSSLKGDSSLSLSATRGVPIQSTNGGEIIKNIYSFFPQEAFDIKDFERLKNPLFNSDESNGEEEDSEDAERETSSNYKDSSNTQKVNYRHWLRVDCAKAIEILKGTFPFEEKPIYNIFPGAYEVIEFLTRVSESKEATNFYFDIENDADQNVTVLGFGVNEKEIYSIPIVDHEYNRPYGLAALTQILRLIQKIFNNPNITVVIHNSLYDLFVLAWKLNIYPPKNVFDTMLAQHRISPETEKSLGHCISTYTSLPYHKDEAIFMPKSREQLMQLLSYNAKDIYGMILVHKGIMRRAAKDTGLAASIIQANKAIVPYLRNSLLGIAVDTKLIDETIKENLRLLKQYKRCIDILVGPSFNLLPSSSQSCARYFHDLLEYPVKKRTKTKAPSVDEEVLLHLKLQNPQNIVIDFCLKYRQKVKENGQIKFKLWTPEFLNKNIPEQSQSSGTGNDNTSSGKSLTNTETVSKLFLPQIQLPLSDGMISSVKEEHQVLLLKQSIQHLCNETLTSKSNERNWALSYNANRATTGWKLSGTTTFRLASAQLNETWGTNLQNPSGEIMRIFIPDPGKVFVQADQAGAEAKIVAYLAKDGNFRQLFINGIKSHVYVALHLFIDIWSKTIPESVLWLSMKPAELVKQPRWKEFVKLVKKDELRYFMAKKTCHAANYGMREWTFISQIFEDSGGDILLSFKEAERFLGTYHYLFPEIHAWQRDVQERLMNTRVLRNLFGFPRFFNGHFGDELWKEGYAFIPQSTVGTITNIGFTEVDEIICKEHPEWDLLNNKHDSLLGQCYINEYAEMGSILQKALEQKLISPRGEEFSMGSEVSVGFNWAKYDKDENPLGMRDFYEFEEEYKAGKFSS